MISSSIRLSALQFMRPLKTSAVQSMAQSVKAAAPKMTQNTNPVTFSTYKTKAMAPATKPATPIVAPINEISATAPGIAMGPAGIAPVNVVTPDSNAGDVIINPPVNGGVIARMPEIEGAPSLEEYTGIPMVYYNKAANSTVTAQISKVSLLA